MSLFFESFGRYFVLLGNCLQSFYRKRPSLSSVTYEMKRWGVDSLGIVFVAALTTGFVMTMQFGYGLARFGGQLYIPKILSLGFCRQMGPIFVALMLSARVASGITAELASMKVTEQVDAIESLGSDSFRILIVPKIIALMVVTPLLTIFADFLGVLGGMLSGAMLLNLSPYDFFFKSFEIMEPIDFLSGIYKSVFFGFLVASLACYYGMRSEGGTRGVGKATTNAVVTSTVSVLLADFVLTKLIWILTESGGM